MGPCCVEGCDVTSEDTYYFEFPTSRLLRKKWLEVIPIAGKLPLGTVVCSRHFSAEDYENVRGKVRLKRKVVPSLMLDENTAKPLKSPAKELDPCDSTTVSVPSPETERNEDRLEARPDDFKHDDVKQADVKQDDVRQADVKQDDVKQDDVKQDDVRHDEVRHDDVKQDDVKQDEVRHDDVKQDDVKQDDTKMDATPVKTRRCKPYEAPFATYWGMPRSSEILKSMVLENGMVETISKAKSPVPDPKEDIEDMITNYQIKNKIPNTALLTEPTPTECVDTIDTIEIPPDAADERPVFIEICVDKDSRTDDASSQDCLMVLESVQVEVDPTTLMLDPDFEPHEEKVPDENEKGDPISLLTSSDEDDVIIEEPQIDCVEVSDETDEDDMPLVKLVKKPQKKLKKKKRKSQKTSNEEEINKLMWGGSYDFYCMQCNFTTKNHIEYTKHISGHSTVLQLCPICGYTTSSKGMLAKHVRKHKEEKKFKCHLCDYRARHKMSLLYHLQCHEGVKSVKIGSKKGFKCKKCGFRSDNKASVIRHVGLCRVGIEFSCEHCDYKTKRKSDLKRHMMRRHRNFNDDDEDYDQMMEILIQ